MGSGRQPALTWGRERRPYQARCLAAKLVAARRPRPGQNEFRQLCDGSQISPARPCGSWLRQTINDS